jgi:hypothetical protein
MDSIYTLVIFTTALILASVAATKTEGSASVGKVRSMLAKDAALPECGGNPSLRAMCEAATAGVRESTRSEYAVPSYVALTCLVVLGYLWYLKIVRRRLYRWAQSFFDSVLPETRRTSGSWVSRLPIVKKLLWLYRGMLKLPLFVFQLIVAVWMSLSLQSIIAEVKASSEEDYDRPWNLGQVIALLAWVPVIAKYMYSLTCKSLFLSFTRSSTRAPTDSPDSLSWLGKRVHDTALKAFYHRKEAGGLRWRETSGRE